MLVSIRVVVFKGILKRPSLKRKQLLHFSEMQ